MAFVVDGRAYKLWDTKQESQGGNKKFGYPGRRGRRRPAEARLKGNIMRSEQFQ